MRIFSNNNYTIIVIVHYVYDILFMMPKQLKYRLPINLLTKYDYHHANVRSLCLV